MSTIVFLHAHPDDEASGTAGSMARATQQGDRVVLVYATNGDHGEVPDDLAPGESIVDRRRKEAAASAAVLGTARVEWLGYSDSGMTGWEMNDEPGSFHGADLDEAAGRLARILDEEDADVLVGYDWHGNYGHPDHVKVHPVAYRAAALATRRPRVLEVTINRDEVVRLTARAREQGIDAPFDPTGPADDGNPMGTPEKEIHWSVDVSQQVMLKREALLCHASQVTDVGMLTSFDDVAFAAMFGREYYREHGNPNGMVEGWPFTPLG
ncbi:MULTISPECIES: PIG-L deacetylase family protein [unclassified Luteococcus]|uniref:PIG-L deacetylase family protein n=1 Tax=unclassified Luteococcus TaxID=2639923 RepID=UPI00313AFAA7